VRRANEEKIKIMSKKKMLTHVAIKAAAAALRKGHDA